MERFKKFLTKKNICLGVVVILCTFFIFKIALDMIFPSSTLRGPEAEKAKNVVVNFVEKMSKRDNEGKEDYMVKDWKAEEIDNLFIGYEDLESLTIEALKLDNYEQYCKTYVSNRKSKEPYASFTTKLNHNYKDKSKYKDEVKTIVFILEKEGGKWKVKTLGTKATIGALI